MTLFSGFLRFVALGRAAIQPTLILFSLVGFSLTSAHAQMFQCPPPSRPVAGGGGMMCQCPDGSFASIAGCASSKQPSGPPPGSTSCGNGLYCKSGLKCASGGKCVEKDVVDCGGGKFCASGSKCAKQGGCLPKDAVDCGSFVCKATNVCAANNKCVTESHARRLRGGGQLEPKVAQSVRPSAVLAREAYSGSANAAGKLGYQRGVPWDSLLAKTGKTKADIEEWRKAGFSATVFTKGNANPREQRIVIAFRGPEPSGLKGVALRDWIKTNWPTQTTGPTPAPYARAAEFAKSVQQQYGLNTEVSVTGYALGGALASFVGNLLKLETTTFNAPTQSLAPVPKLGAEAAPNQTNIITAGDPVSDPLADPEEKRLGAEANSLPGQTFVVQPKTQASPPDVTGLIRDIDELIDKKEG